MAISVDPEDRFRVLAEEFFRRRRDIHGQWRLTFYSSRDHTEQTLRLAIKHELGITATYSLNEDILDSKADQLDLFMHALEWMDNEILRLLTDPVNNPTL